MPPEHYYYNIWHLIQINSHRLSLESFFFCPQTGMGCPILALPTHRSRTIIHVPIHPGSPLLINEQPEIRHCKDFRATARAWHRRSPMLFPTQLLKGSPFFPKRSQNKGMPPRGHHLQTTLNNKSRAMTFMGIPRSNISAPACDRLR